MEEVSSSAISVIEEISSSGVVEEVVGKTDIQQLIDLLNSETVSAILTAVVSFFSVLCGILVCFGKLKTKVNDVKNSMENSNSNMTSVNETLKANNAELTKQIASLNETNLQLIERLEETEKKLAEQSTKNEIISHLPEAFKMFVNAQSDLVSSGVSSKINKTLNDNSNISNEKSNG